jgi:hypothetical protein
MRKITFYCGSINLHHPNVALETRFVGSEVGALGKYNL